MFDLSQPIIKIKILKRSIVNYSLSRNNSQRSYPTFHLERGGNGSEVAIVFRLLLHDEVFNTQMIWRRKVEISRKTLCEAELEAVAAVTASLLVKCCSTCALRARQDAMKQRIRHYYKVRHTKQYFWAH